MMQSCPCCSSTDLVAIEIADTEEETLYECENCGEQFHGDEM
jgi:transcription elongation factor Elf1